MSKSYPALVQNLKYEGYRQEFWKLKNLAIIKSLYLKDLRAKQIYEDMLNTLGDQFPSCEIEKNWIASLKRRKFSTEDEHWS